MKQPLFSQIPFTRSHRIDRRAWEFLDLCAAQNIEARLCGGCIRDAFIDLKNDNYSTDIDVAIAAPPPDVINFCTKHQLKYIPTGIKHGTLTILYKGLPIEATSLRSDKATDGRHATVTYGKSFITDAARRDFTINALYVNHNRILYDAFNGLNDLHNHRLRFIGDAHQRIREDYLRLWRYFRFWGRFGKGPVDLAVLPPLHTIIQGVSNLSIERVQHELFHILNQPWPGHIIKSLHQYGLLEHTFKTTVDTLMLRKLVIVERALPSKQICAIRRLSALLSIKNTDDLPLKLSRHDHQKRTILLTKNLKEIALHYPKWWLDANLLEQARKQDISLCHAKTYMRSLLPIPPFPVTAQDLINMGYTPGKPIGLVLNDIKNQWFDGHFNLTKKECLTIARDHPLFPAQ